MRELKKKKNERKKQEKKKEISDKLKNSTNNKRKKNRNLKVDIFTNINKKGYNGKVLTKLKAAEIRKERKKKT